MRTDATTHGWVGIAALAAGASAYNLLRCRRPRRPTFLRLLAKYFPRGPELLTAREQLRTLLPADQTQKTQASRFYFLDSASAGENVVITNQGGDNVQGRSRMAPLHSSGIPLRPAKQPLLTKEVK